MHIRGIFPSSGISYTSRVEGRTAEGRNYSGLIAHRGRPGLLYVVG
jgi:hypothetical protein